MITLKGEKVIKFVNCYSCSDWIKNHCKRKSAKESESCGRVKISRRWIWRMLVILKNPI